MASDMPLPISFEDDDKDKDGMAYRGGNIGGTQIMNSLNEQIQTQTMRSSKNEQSARLRLDNVQSYRTGFGHKYPVQIITLELDEAPKEMNNKPRIEVISAIESNKTIEMKEERYTNDISSYAVKDQTPEQVLSGLTAVLVGYSQDLDIRLNEQENSIEGVVFVENYYGIKFKINIWADKSNKDEITTRFELVRTDGDALATAKFLGDIKTQFFIDIKDETISTTSTTKDKNKEKEPDFNLVSLSLDATSLDLKELFRQLSNEEIKEDEEDSITKQELDEVNEALSNNEQESVDELQFLHERLKENGAISKDIVNHEPLVKTIIAEAMKNRDICVSRACLLILEQLCNDDKIGLLLVEQYALFDNLVKLLNHEFALIKNYSVRLLAKLSSQKKWNMNKDAAGNIEKLVKNYQSEWKDSILANNGFLKSQMFDEIYKKLSESQ